MRAIAAAALLVASLVGCGVEPAGDVTGAASDQASAGGTLACGQVAGATYTTHWTRLSGTCAAAGDLAVTVANPGDLCGAIGQRVPAGLADGEFSVGCFINTAACHVYAAVGFHGCQGEYAITFGP